MLSGAFFIEGFLMANHKKHEELDQAVHSLLVRHIAADEHARCSMHWLFLRTGLNAAVPKRNLCDSASVSLQRLLQV